MSIQTQGCQLISIERAAKLLCISRATLYRLQHRDPDFPKLVKIGGSSRFRLVDIEIYVDRAPTLDCSNHAPGVSNENS